MDKKIIIIGAGENGTVVANALSHDFEISGFLDDQVKRSNVIGKSSNYISYIKTHRFFISIGRNDVREKIYHEIKSHGGIFVNAIHPSSKYEKSVKIGENVFIGALTYVNVNAIIGDGTFINNGCIIEHDNTIGSFVHAAPGVITGGGCHIGTGSFIGLGACINDHLKIGAWTIIGSGSVVTNNVPDHVTAVGIPAKIIKCK